MVNSRFPELKDALCCALVIRFFLHGLPALLIVAIAVAFFNETRLSSDKKNEMTIGSIAEPSMLNPIQQADSAASDVGGMIFNGLLKYNADLEITTDLAKSFALSQHTTIFFDDPKAVPGAMGKLFFMRGRWADWKLTDARQDGSSLVLTFSEPGMAASQEIMGLFDAKTLVSATIIRVDLEGKAAETLKAWRATETGAKAVRDWVESDAAFEVTVAGDPAPVVKDLQDFLTSRTQKGTVAAGDVLPFLAEPIVDFTLRDDVRWHDGAPFTSADVAFTYRAIMDDAFASPRKSDFIYIQSLETPDPHTVRAVYRKPYSPALQSWMIGLLPSHLLEGKPPEWWAQNFNRSPIGTGPFKFSEWKTNEYVRLVRNPDYFDAPGPWLDSVVYRILSDQLSLRLAFETKQVDFWGVDPWAVSEFQKDKRFDLFSYPSSSYSYVGWNLKRPIFQDERVRRALAHAVNVPDMIKYILYGYGVQSTGIFLPQMWFFNPDVKPIPYDVEKARHLLAEAGWKPGPDGILTKDGQRFTFTIITNNGTEIRRDIATLVQDNFRQIGIEVKIEIYEWAVFLKNFINKGDFDAMVLGWALGPDYDQYQIWHSSQTKQDQFNVIGYNNPEVDKLLVNIRQEYNRDKIIEMAGKLQSIIYKDQPYLFLFVPQGTSVLWKDSYRIRRPDGKGGWIDSPVEMTKAGWSYYSEWFYRPEYADKLPR